MVQEKINQREQVKETLTQIKDLIRLEVKEAYCLREAEKNIGVAEKSIEQAEENFRVSQLRYRDQVTTSLEALDAQPCCLGQKQLISGAICLQSGPITLSQGHGKLVTFLLRERTIN